MDRPQSSGLLKARLTGSRAGGLTVLEGRIGVNAYRAVLAIPGARSFVTAAFVGRLPMSMLGLGIIVLVQSRSGSYGLAGAVTAALAVSFAAAAPVAGRLADRAGQGRVLRASLAVHLAGLAGLVAAALAGAPRWALFAAAVPAGAAFPQLPAMVRARWAALLGDDPALQTAYALESVLDEVVYIVGPVIVVALATQVFPAAGLGGAAVFAAAGTLWFAALRGTEPVPSRPARRRGAQAMATPGLRVLAAVFVLTGTIFGTLEVVMVAFATGHRARALAGPLLAAFAGGSLLAGLWYGARDWHAPAQRRFLAALAALAAGTLLFAAATSIPQMAAAALAAGFTVSPALIAGFTLTERLLPGPVLTEGFAWLNAATGIGLAAGYSTGGLAVDAAGTRVAFLAAAAAALLATGTAALGQRWLHPSVTLAGEVAPS
jgi:MFS family permease